MAATGERVWGLHKFTAENADEVSFDVGETILVVEKDDMYGDGWWQGTNEKGHTGLFPFSYATKNQELAENAKALALSAGGVPQPASNSAPGQGQPGVMNSTMADVDQALTELHAGDSNSRRRSFQSERTADLSGDDDLTEEGESEYQSRANARAALAANAKADAALQQQKEKEEAERRRIHAKKVFEEEEARHRDLLLKKEEERKEAAANGQLPQTSDKPKVAPIEGVDMSDESDSEGSANGLDTYSSQKSQTQNASAQMGRLALEDSQREHARDPDVKDELDDAPSGPQQANQNGFNAAQQLSAEQNQALQTSSESSSAKPAALAAGGALAAAGAVVGATHAASADSQQRAPSMDSAQQRSQSTDQQSLTGSAKASHQDTASQSGTGTHTAATSIADMQTPKSASAPLATANASPVPSATTANRPPAPEGDPNDWTVDQVVEWARSRGWDENAIVSKFQEHEISGDVLLEMDINILKEIDIIAFGKRFQVANAIKELKGQGGLSPALGVPGSSSSGRMASTGAQSYNSGDSQPAAAASTAAAAAAGATSYSGVGLGIPSGQTHGADTTAANRALSYDTGTVIQHDSPIAGASRDRDFTGNSMPPLGSANGTGSMSLSAMADAALLNRQGNNFTPPPQLGALGASGDTPSPRKRASKVPGSGERASFFAGLNPRQRKPPASTPGATIDEEGKPGRGTLSRFGLNRLGRNGQGSGDFKNQISLPTSTPTYDAEGDTARRNRASANSNNEAGRALGGYEAAVGGGHGRQTSVGSAEQQKIEGFNVADSQNGEGPVISRIRPVDVEGWMRKKGERYNVWKPRYLALKGGDLVILRDPQAPKIKGYVSMKGYKVIADENTNPGKYGFKILHETEKPHYFSSDDPVLVREWMKGLMKATIGRDASFPVISSYNNATISLKEAQSMYPPPRPPSPASRLRTQRAKARENPGELTAKDAAVLMGISQPQKGQTGILQHSDYATRPDDMPGRDESVAGHSSSVSSLRGIGESRSSWSRQLRKKSIIALGGSDQAPHPATYRPQSIVLGDEGSRGHASVDEVAGASALTMDEVSITEDVTTDVGRHLWRGRSGGGVTENECGSSVRSSSQSNLFRWPRPAVAVAMAEKAVRQAKRKLARPKTADDYRSESGSSFSDKSPLQEQMADQLPPTLELSSSVTTESSAGFLRALTPESSDFSSSNGRSMMIGRSQVKHWIRTSPPPHTPPLSINKVGDVNSSTGLREPVSTRSAPVEGAIHRAPIVTSGQAPATVAAGSSVYRHKRNLSTSLLVSSPLDIGEDNDDEEDDEDEDENGSTVIGKPAAPAKITSTSAPWGLTKYEKILGLIPGPPPADSEHDHRPRGPLPVLPIPRQTDEALNILNGRSGVVNTAPVSAPLAVVGIRPPSGEQRDVAMPASMSFSGGILRSAHKDTSEAQRSDNNTSPCPSQSSAPPLLHPHPFQFRRNGLLRRPSGPRRNTRDFLVGSEQERDKVRGEGGEGNSAGSSQQQQQQQAMLNAPNWTSRVPSPSSQYSSDMV